MDQVDLYRRRLTPPSHRIYFAMEDDSSLQVFRDSSAVDVAMAFNGKDENDLQAHANSSSAGTKTLDLSVANSEDQLDLYHDSRSPVTRQFRLVPPRFREPLEFSGLSYQLSFYWPLIISPSSYGSRRHGPSGPV